MEFSFQFRAGQAQRLAPEQPMKLLLLGNFGGARQDVAALAERRPRKVDIDNLDAVLAHFAPCLELELAQFGGALQINFSSFDDFHPDNLYDNLPLFANLRATRARLLNPATFAAAATELGAPPPSAAPAPAGQAQPVSDFAALLGRSAAPPQAAAGSLGQLDALIRNAVAPHIVQAHDPSMYLAAVDDAAASLMRAILHHPQFQALEALWRGVHFLITNLNLDDGLQLHLLQAGQEETAADLRNAGTELSRAALYRTLVEAPRQGADGTPWALLLSDWRFGPDALDVHHLAAFGAIAAAAGAPLLAAAKPELLGAQSLAQQADGRDWGALDAESAARWQALRSAPQAAWIGLCLPRLLQRLPYGKASDPVSRFTFEENVMQHQEFLWGSGAFAPALLLAQAWLEDGWEMQTPTQLEIGDLPAYTWREEGEARLLPAAEACLSEQAADRMLQAGVMPLHSYKNRNAVRLLRLQSMASPACALRGRWGA
ncbi:type VI secretion system contractile sheath large subunit [Massilia sp. W12]|uniref:type VI secretion system contractile sheath domain-containing protein n=1 Tax=Massilia sp. W12 TaxID=3126507 RepID=UPI0030D12A0C